MREALPQDGAGGGRGFSRLHRARSRELLKIADALRSSQGRARGRCETARRGGRRQALRAVAGGGHEDCGHERDHAPARPRA